MVVELFDQVLQQDDEILSGFYAVEVSGIKLRDGRPGDRFLIEVRVVLLDVLPQRVEVLPHRLRRDLLSGDDEDREHH